jgi:lipoprotein-releasing system ATP-binding protein
MTDIENLNDINPVILVCNNISKSFHENNNDLVVLKNIDLSIHSGERVAITGASGSGKTTLLQIMSGLDEPSSGEVRIDGELVNKIAEVRKSFIRNRYIGFVYQFHHLLVEFSAQENVAMPLLIRGMDKNQAMDAAATLLERVGLGRRLSHRPPKLSGGERQRAAIARALITKPKLLLADEPTGNLDLENGRYVMKLMLELHQEFATSLVVVTHDELITKKMDRILELKDGCILAR